MKKGIVDIIQDSLTESSISRHVFAILLTLQFLDISTTRMFIALGLQEGNPFMAWMIEQSWTLTWIFKGLVGSFVSLVLCTRPLFALPLILLYVGVIILNSWAIITFSNA